MRSERRPRRVKAVKQQRCSRVMWGIEDEWWQPPGSNKNWDGGQELGSSSPLNHRGQLQSGELEQIVAKAWEAGSEEEGGRKRLVRWSRTLVQQ